MRQRNAESTRELFMLVRELAILDTAYKQADAMDRHLETLEAIDEVDDLRQAALNHRGQP